MSLVQLLVVLIVLGLALWLINNFLPLQPPIKTIINVIVVVVIIVWLLSAVFGIGDIYIGPRK
jgi:hypothetical protein